MPNTSSYMNEDEIDQELQCIICRQPFREPVTSVKCHHTFCKECIDNWMQRRSLCPVCAIRSFREDYQLNQSHVLRNQLDRLLVRCDACQQINIQRGNFQTHTERCAYWSISCTASDIRCPWTGMRQQLNNHVTRCTFQRIRPIIDDLQGRIQSQNARFDEFQVQINQLICWFILVVVLVFIFIWPSRRSQEISRPPETSPPQKTSFLHKLLDSLLK